MASIGSLEALANRAPVAIRAVLVDMVREAFRSIRFGAPDEDAVAAENMGGHLVPFTTSGTSNNEVAVQHKLGRIPRMAMQLLALDTVNATMPVLTVTRAADATYLYIKSATTSASGWLYVE